MKKTINRIKTEEFNPNNRGNYLKLLKKESVYGPINSRRLGLSLGINPIQGGLACNWNCVYCQYGLDNITEVMRNSKKLRFTKLDEIKSALENKLQSNEHFDSITICGPTEPTLHPKFNEIVNLVTKMRDKYRKDIPTSLFTNACRAKELKLRTLDYVFMKLDVGNEETFRRFNRPKGISFRELVEQLKEADVRRRIIQTMLCKGDDGNFDNRNLFDHINALKEIKPDEVHLYSLLYAPFPNVKVSPVSLLVMNELAKYIESNVKTKALVFVDPVSEGSLFRY